MRISLLLLSLLFVVTCSSVTEPGNPDKTLETYMPLAIGNRWVYEGSFKASNGEVYTWQSTWEIVDREENVYHCLIDTKDRFFRISGGKLYSWHTPDTGRCAPVWFEEPLPEETSTVTVPAGTFENCIVLEVGEEGRYYTLAPDVGIIKGEDKELIEYEVK